MIFSARFFLFSFLRREKKKHDDQSSSSRSNLSVFLHLNVSILESHATTVPSFLELHKNDCLQFCPSIPEKKRTKWRFCLVHIFDEPDRAVAYHSHEHSDLAREASRNIFEVPKEKFSSRMEFASLFVLPFDIQRVTSDLLQDNADAFPHILSKSENVFLWSENNRSKKKDKTRDENTHRGTETNETIPLLSTVSSFISTKQRNLIGPSDGRWKLFGLEFCWSWATVAWIAWPIKFVVRRVAETFWLFELFVWLSGRRNAFAKLIKIL